MNKIQKLKGREFLKIILISLVALFVPVLLFMYAVQAKKYTDLSREIVELENKQEKLIEENKRLVSDISILSSAERIEKIATEELGMHKAESDDIIRVEMTGEKKND
ncbi:MAG: cell division protein FtsL [Treponema sp.]|nr:cell division protein FtsL [Treponema sp.]